MTNANKHRHTWQTKGAHPVFTLVIEDWLGPTAGILRCDACDHAALAHLLAWRGQHCEWRIFGIKLLAPEVVETYLANINRDYCDVSRKQSETEALFAAAASEAQLVEFNVSTGTIDRVSADDYRTSPKSWQALTEKDYKHWSPLLEG